MTLDFSSAGIGAIRQAMMLGLAHHPLPEAAGESLTALALVAARQRYARPVPPPREQAETRSGDAINPASLMPDAARQAMLRLFTGRDGSTSDGVAFAVLREIRRSGVALHPFDFPRLEAFITRHADVLGVPERRWLKEIRPDEGKSADTYHDEAPVDAATLPQAGKTQKLAFLKELRAGDPAAARDLIASLLPAEAAAVRAELVGLLAVSLSMADATLLESLVNDRAQSVRDAARLLLARLPGSAAYGEKLERLRDRIEIKKAGLLRRRIVLALRQETRPHAAFRSFVGFHENKELFEGLRLADLARMLGLAEDEMIAAALEEAELGHLVFRAAAGEMPARDLSIFAPLFKGDLASLTLFTLTDLLPRLAAREREALLALTLAPSNWSSLPLPANIEEIHASLGNALPLALATDLLRSPPWREAMASGEEARIHWLNAVAPLVPRQLSQQYLRDAEPQARRAALYHRFLLALPEPTP